MGMEFPLTPHTKSILCGRGMCEDDRLLCAATNCLFHPKDSPDPNFGRSIEVKGYIVCSRCGVKTKYSEAAEFNDKLRKTIVRCKACKKVAPNTKIVWTQIVVSRHRRSRHEYFHEECWDAMFIDVDRVIELPSPESVHFSGFSADYRLMRLIKWALKA